MSIKVLAYDHNLVEMRFHRINFDIPSYEEIEADGGDLSIETVLRFGMDSDSLYCTITAKTTMIPESQQNLPEDEQLKIEIEIAGTGRFVLADGHEITGEKLNELSAEEVRSFSSILDPLLVDKLKGILSGAGIDGVNLPLQLRSLR